MPMNERAMGIVGILSRGLEWILVTVFSIALAGLATFLPLSLLPGDFQTDFVNGHWIKVAGALFVLTVLTLRMAPMATEHRLSIGRAARFIWTSVTAFMLAFWPLALAVWVNAYNVHNSRSYDMVVTGIDTTRILPAVTPIQTFRLRDVHSDWSADLQVTDQRKQSARVNSCMRIAVRQGRIGLDWISDARPVACKGGT
jgi:hypothetical protein